MMKNSSVKHIDNIFIRYPHLTVVREDLIKSIEILIDSYKKEGKLLVAGNGGSASDAQHIVGELMKGFVLPRHIGSELRQSIDDEHVSNALQYGLPAISLVSETAFVTAFSNDQSPDVVFAQGVLALGKKNDVVLLISTSGNSANCVYAAKVAKALNLKVISLTGQKESKLSQLSDVTIKVPEVETYKIQELHLPVYHLICMVLENEFFGE